MQNCSERLLICTSASMKKMLMVALMVMVAGTAAYAAMPAKRVECNVKGKTKLVKTVDACKDLGGKVVEVKKVSKR